VGDHDDWSEHVEDAEVPALLQASRARPRA